MHEQSSDKIFLSFVLPIYNGEQFLTSTLESLISQSCKDFEVLVIDDGSTDSSLQIIKKYQQHLAIKILKNERTGSWTKNANLGLRHAVGRFASILHQDDLLENQRVEKLRTAWQVLPQSNVIVHPVKFVDDAGQKLGIWKCPFTSSRSYLSEQQVLSRLIVQNFIAVPAIAFRIDTTSEFFNPALWYTGDWELWLRYARHGNWQYLDEVLASFRVHSKSQTVRGGSNSGEYRNQLEQVLLEFLPGVDKNCQDPGRLKKAALLSVEVNLFLLSLFKKWRPNYRQLLRRALPCGPKTWWYYLQYSRIIERVSARLRTRKTLGSSTEKDSPSPLRERSVAKGGYGKAN